MNATNLIKKRFRIKPEDVDRWKRFAERDTNVVKFRIHHDKGLMVGPRLVRREGWYLEFWVAGCTETAQGDNKK